MWPYWLMYLVPASAALLQNRAHQRPQARNLRRSVPWAWIVAATVLALLIGLRDEVGGDWNNYVENLENIRGAGLFEVISSGEPGYQLVSWVSLQLGLDIYGVNAVCGALFAFGLMVFCRSLPQPWLALATAMPYLVIVVGMGYTRQGVALACGMLGVRALQQKSVWGFLAWVLLGATFHKSATVLLPVAVLVNARHRLIVIPAVIAVTVIAYSVLLSDSVDALYAGYIEQEYQSEGAFVRLVMNAIPAAILLIWRKRFYFRPEDAPLWRWCAWLSLILLALLFVTSATTAIDRFALYLLPIQLVVFSQLPSVLGSPRRQNRGWILAVVVYYGLVQFVWLNFAVHANGWLPYQFFPLRAAA